MSDRVRVVFPDVLVGPTCKWDDPPPAKHPEHAGKMHKHPACCWKHKPNNSLTPSWPDSGHMATPTYLPSRASARECL